MPQGQLIRETNPAQGFQAALVPQHELANGDYKATGENAPLPVSIEDGGAAAQVDVQYRKQATKQIHSSVVIPANSQNSSGWIDTDGFNDVVLHLTNDNTTSNSLEIDWSHDQVTKISWENPLISAGGARRKAHVPTAARYMMITIKNADGAAPHTMSTWAYLKV